MVLLKEKAIEGKRMKGIIDDKCLSLLGNLEGRRERGVVLKEKAIEGREGRECG